MNRSSLPRLRRGRARRRGGARSPAAALALLCTILGASLGFARALEAAVHVCVAADGSRVFQDYPCRVTPPAADATAPPIEPPPLELHPSWFARPAEAVGRARCDGTGCRCGDHRRVHGGGLETAISDALYLDGAWHRYESSLDDWRRGLADPGADAPALRRALDEAACDILMSQRTLRDHATATLESLRALARAAEDRGHDTTDACEGGDREACRMYAAHALYHRLLSDLVPLREPRDAGVDAELTPPR